MTEAEWLTSADPERLLNWLQKSKRHRPTRRKLALFGAACARRIADLAADPFAYRSLEMVEQLTDGLAGQDEWRVWYAEYRERSPRAANEHILAWVVRIGESVNWTSPEGAARSVAGYVAENLGRDERSAQCDLLRDVLGNPYRPVTLDPAWLTSTVTTLARQMYEARDFSAMPILADALQDAGCEHPDILAHCRADGVHVRGCWVVDLILGKE